VASFNTVMAELTPESKRFHEKCILESGKTLEESNPRLTIVKHHFLFVMFIRSVPLQIVKAKSGFKILLVRDL
jgi:hypothetical protein